MKICWKPRQNYEEKVIHAEVTNHDGPEIKIIIAKFIVFTGKPIKCISDKAFLVFVYMEML